MKFLKSEFTPKKNFLKPIGGKRGESVVMWGIFGLAVVLVALVAFSTFRGGTANTSLPNGQTLGNSVFEIDDNNNDATGIRVNAYDRVANNPNTLLTTIGFNGYKIGRAHV